MAIAYVKKASKTDTDGGGSTTVSISTTSGHLLVASCIFVNGASSGAPFSSITDSAGNTWTLPSSFSDANPPAAYVGGLGVAIAYCQNADHVTSVTFHYSSAGSKFIGVVSEYSGAATSGVRHDSGRAIDNSTPTIFNPAHGLAVAAACTSSASSISGGFTTLLNSSGNLSGYRLPGTSGDNDSMGWSPSQNGAAAIISFDPDTGVNHNGVATLTEVDSLTAEPTRNPTATLVEDDAISASPVNVVPQIEFSAVTTDALESHGIPLRHGLTTYNWSSMSSPTYASYVSLQDGQLRGGGYNAAADVNLYRLSADNWKTDDSLEIGNSLTVDGNATIAGDSAVNGDAVVAGTLEVDGTPGAASTMATCPTSSTTATFVAFTNAQWPALSVVVPPSETILVGLRAYGYNSNSASSNLDVCVQVKQGSTVLVSPSQGIGPHIISRLANSTDVFLGYSEIVVGTDLLSGMTGQTITITPFWRLSSGDIGPTGQTSQTATISSAAMHAFPSLYSSVTSL